MANDRLLILLRGYTYTTNTSEHVQTHVCMHEGQQAHMQTRRYQISSTLKQLPVTTH